MIRHGFCLAQAGSTEWRLAFIPNELHLYVALYRNGRMAHNRGYMTIEDFLVRIPEDDLQKQAHVCLVHFLIESIQSGARKSE